MIIYFRVHVSRIRRQLFENSVIIVELNNQDGAVLNLLSAVQLSDRLDST